MGAHMPATEWRINEGAWANDMVHMWKEHASAFGHTRIFTYAARSHAMAMEVAAIEALHA